MTSVREFISIFSQLNNNEENSEKNLYHKEYLAKEILSQTLSNFLGSLSEESRRIVSLNIISKFAENKSMEKIKKAKALFRIYSKQGKLQRLVKKRETLRMWKKICQDIISSLNSRSYVLETSAYKKEMEELRNCTFKPSINKNFDFVMHRDPSGCQLPVHERLYTDLERINNKKALKKYQHENKEQTLTPFTPDTSLTMSRNKENSESFFKRQEKFSKSKAKRKEQIRTEMEEEVKNKHTFSPKILKSKRVKVSLNRENLSISTLSSPKSPVTHSQSYSHLQINAPAHIRLYEDNFRRERNMQMTKKIISDEVEKMSEKYVSSYKSKSPSESPRSHQVVDYKKLEKLYKDHKKINQQKKELQKEFDKEQGITFKPEFYTNTAKYSPGLGFNERNKKLLEDKKNFCEVYQQIYDENLEGMKWGARKVSPQEFEEINKSVIERLYVKGVERTMMRNSIEDVNKREKVDFQRYLRSGHGTLTSGGSTGANFNYNSTSNQHYLNEEEHERKSNVALAQSHSYQSPKYANTVKHNSSKPQNKNLTFGRGNSSREGRLDEERTTGTFINIPAQNNKIVVNNYTFGGKDKGMKKIDKNYQYKFEDDNLDYGEEEDEINEPNEPDEVSLDAEREERVKPMMVPKEKNKNFVLDNLNSVSPEKLDMNQGKIQNENTLDSNSNYNVDPTSFRSNSMKKLLERKYSASNLKQE